MSRYGVHITGRDPRHPYNAGGRVTIEVDAGSRRTAVGTPLRRALRATGGLPRTADGVVLREFHIAGISQVGP